MPALATRDGLPPFTCRSPAPTGQDTSRSLRSRRKSREDSGETCEQHDHPPGRRARHRRAGPRPHGLRRTADGDSGDGGDSGVSGSVLVDGSSTVFPMSDAAAELLERGEPRHRGLSVRVRHGRRVREVLRRRDRHLRRVAADRGGGDRCLRGRGHRVHRAPGRNRRAHRGRAPRPRRGLPHRRPAGAALGARLDGHELEGPRPELPRPGDLALRPRHRLGHLRLHGLRDRRPRRRGARHPRRLRGLRGRQRARPGRRRDRGCDGLLRLHVLRGEHRQPQGARRSTTATGVSSRRRRPPRPGSTRRSPDRCSST